MSAALLLGILGAGLLVAATVVVMVLEALDAVRSPDSPAASGRISPRRQTLEATMVVLVVLSVAYAAFRIAVLAG